MYLNPIMKTKKVSIRSGFLQNQFSCIHAPDKKLVFVVYAAVLSVRCEMKESFDLVNGIKVASWHH